MMKIDQSFHVLGAFLLVSGTLLAGVVFETARHRETAAEIALLLGLTRIGVALVGTGALLLLAIIVAMVFKPRF